MGLGGGPENPKVQSQVGKGSIDDTLNNIRVVVR